MSEIKPQVQVTIDHTLRLTESEAKGLVALAGYGEDAFFKAFYGTLGSHYLKPHEQSIRALFQAIQAQLPRNIEAVEATRYKLRHLNQGNGS